MNPLASLIGNYGDSDEESDSETGTQRAAVGRVREVAVVGMQTHEFAAQSASIHPAPIAHCRKYYCFTITFYRGNLV